MIKFATPLQLAFISAFIVSVGFSMAYGITTLIVYGELLWKTLIVGSLVLFAITFFLFNYILQRFIYDRIRLIYKTIRDMKAPKGQKIPVGLNRADIIKETNQEVIDWATAKKNEVEELKKLETYRREFLGNVSHELKTPIFNIQGYVLTLLDGGLDDPSINRKYLLRTEESINRMISIVEDLESISRLESGELKPNFTTFDIVSLAREVMEFLELKATARNITLHFGRNFDYPIYVNADRMRIQQVLTNLVVNSINYGTENGRTKISFFDMDENILIEVTDSGIGIPREEIPRVFERFYRGDKSRSFRNGEGGTGLGLAIVKHIIEAHNQTINVRSTLGLGTTFGFTLSKGKNPQSSRRNVFMV